MPSEKQETQGFLVILVLKGLMPLLKNGGGLRVGLLGSSKRVAQSVVKLEPRARIL